jgi:hypothetical protein
MTESQKLSVVRDKLVRRRRALVEGFQGTAAGLLDGDELSRVQKHGRETGTADDNSEGASN